MKRDVFYAVMIIIGTCIGAGFLGIPYVAAKTNFFIALLELILIGALILIINLMLGKIAIKTKENHQLSGYAMKYLGKKGYYLMQFSMLVGIYSAIIAYLIGIGKSLSILTSYDYFTLSIATGIITAIILKGNLSAVKSFEKWANLLILTIILILTFSFLNKIDYQNFLIINSKNVFLPFGVILFAMLSFAAIPQAKIILKNKKDLKKAIIIGTIIPIIFYALFTFIVVGYLGPNTPQVSTLALGKASIILGILTMLTSYIALGNALQEEFVFDEKINKRTSWLLVTSIPVAVFILMNLLKIDSFAYVLSVGGNVSGILTIVLIIAMYMKSFKFLN